MFASLLITLRESFETVLVIGIILTYLSVTKQTNFRKYVLWGAGCGILLSVAIGLLLNLFLGGLEGRVENLFEGILMLATALFLTWMILWIHRQKDYAEKIRRKVSNHIENGFSLGIFVLSATSVLREGTEAVLYLKAISLAGWHNQVLGAFFGVTAGLFAGLLIFSFAIRAHVRTIFKITTFFLLLFAAGLVSNGVHEFQEAGILPIFSFDPIFNLSRVMDHKSFLGSFLNTLFGYTSKPTVLELGSYVFYMVFVWQFERFTREKIDFRSQA